MAGLARIRLLVVYGNEIITVVSAGVLAFLLRLDFTCRRPIGRRWLRRC